MGEKSNKKKLLQKIAFKRNEYFNLPLLNIDSLNIED